MIVKNLEGQRFGSLTVLKRVDSPDNHRRWLCQCDCGNTREYYTYQLTNHSKIKCDKCSHKDRGKLLVKPLAGKTFGELEVIEYAGEEKRQDGRANSLWKCKCSCGNIVYKNTQQLRAVKNPNCGCVNKPKDGRSSERLYSIYRGMLYRCSNKNLDAYKYYGARGIKVCPEWMGQNGFDAFRKWSYENGYEESKSIDRIDVNGNYEPNNCRWVTWIQQGNNTRRNVYLTYNEKTQTMTQWSRELGLTVATIKGRLKHSDDVNAILSRPIDTKYHHGKTDGTFFV